MNFVKVRIPSCVGGGNNPWAAGVSPHEAGMVEYSAELRERCLPFLEEREARVLLQGMAPVALSAGEDLFGLEDPADCLYLLVSGRIAVRKRTGFGNRMQVVALLDPGAPIGEGGLLNGQSRGATLTAVSESHLLVLSRQGFNELAATNPEITFQLLKWLLERVSLRLRKSSERLAQIL